MSDQDLLGMAIMLIGAGGMFAAAVIGVVNGSVRAVAAVVLSGIGFAGLLVAVLQPTGVDSTLAQRGGLSCLSASFLLVVPLSGTELRFDLIRLIGAASAAFGGLILLATAVDSQAVGTA